MPKRKNPRELLYDRIVVGYHGCDHLAAEALLSGHKFRVSKNPWDWLGTGIYFWEYGPDRALQWAKFQKEYKTSKGRSFGEPAVVGALIQLGRCFDLMDTRNTALLADGYEALRRAHEDLGKPLPVNAGPTPEKKLRKLDCAVINLLLSLLEERGAVYDTVRCGFVEGAPAFPGAGIHKESHIQLSVRNPSCILGVFDPR